MYNNSHPVFHGGSIVPPSDGSISLSLVSYSLKTQQGQIIVALSSIGFILSALSAGLFIHFRNREAIRSSGSIVYSGQIILGCIIGYASLLWNLGAMNRVLCSVSIAGTAIAFGMCASAIIFRNIQVLHIFKLQSKWKKEDASFYGRVYIMGDFLVVAFDVVSFPFFFRFFFFFFRTQQTGTH
ncbi:hypothetical protein BDR26DRAFT_46842 [Obelidium mucronatum]|nr:hypothetical protein BDR26DRAFT_46842 [Obelidium mucronatum]